jgi:putative methyltransferase (TIGR04325 family)
MTELSEVFPDYDAALNSCGSGYNDAVVADVVAYKTALPIDALQLAPEQAVNSMLAVGFAAAEIEARPMTVIDFGGGCGFHYFRLAPAMRVPLRWAIVETTTMADRAVRVAQGRFEVFTEIAAAARSLDRIDVVHASGAVQYVPDPLTTLKTLVALRARYFLLARFPCWAGQEAVSVQTAFLAENGIGPLPPGIADRQFRFPVTFNNIKDVMRTLDGYELVLGIDSPSAVYEFRGQTIPGRSLLFRRRD